MKVGFAAMVVLVSVAPFSGCGPGDGSAQFCADSHKVRVRLDMVSMMLSTLQKTNAVLEPAPSDKSRMCADVALRAQAFAPTGWKLPSDPSQQNPHTILGTLFLTDRAAVQTMANVELDPKTGRHPNSLAYGEAGVLDYDLWQFAAYLDVFCNDTDTNGKPLTNDGQQTALTTLLDLIQNRIMTNGISIYQAIKCPADSSFTLNMDGSEDDELRATKGTLTAPSLERSHEAGKRAREVAI